MSPDGLSIRVTLAVAMQASFVQSILANDTLFVALLLDGRASLPVRLVYNGVSLHRSRDWLIRIFTETLPYSCGQSVSDACPLAWAFCRAERCRRGGGAHFSLSAPPLSSPLPAACCSPGDTSCVVKTAAACPASDLYFSRLGACIPRTCSPHAHCIIASWTRQARRATSMPPLPPHSATARVSS